MEAPCSCYHDFIVCTVALCSVGFTLYYFEPIIEQKLRQFLVMKHIDARQYWRLNLDYIQKHLFNSLLERCNLFLVLGYIFAYVYIHKQQL